MLPCLFGDYLMSTIHSATQTRSKAYLKRLRNIYWRKLVDAGMPDRAAKSIAGAIARYDLAHTIPSPRHQQLISRYCTAIVRAKLWRLDLLIGNPPALHDMSSSAS